MGDHLVRMADFSVFGHSADNKTFITWHISLLGHYRNIVENNKVTYFCILNAYEISLKFVITEIN